MTNLPAAITHAYALQLVKDLMPRQILAVAKGAHPDDFCDANMALAAAFESVLGRESWMPSDLEEGDCTEAQVDADLALWNAASSPVDLQGLLARENDEATLTAMLEAWGALQGLECRSADEMLADLGSAADVEEDGDNEWLREWLREFCEVWGEVMRADAP